MSKTLEEIGELKIPETNIKFKIIWEYKDKGYSVKDILERLPTLKKEEVSFAFELKEKVEWKFPQKEKEQTAHL